MPNNDVRCNRCKGVFVKSYRNKRTGKLMRAEDYGYKAWPFGGCRCRKSP